MNSRVNLILQWDSRNSAPVGRKCLSIQAHKDPTSTKTNLVVQKHKTEQHRIPACTLSTFFFFFLVNLIHPKSAALVREDTVMKGTGQGLNCFNQTFGVLVKLDAALR